MGLSGLSASRCAALSRFDHDLEQFVSVGALTTFLSELQVRLGKFHLEIEPSKTKLIAFGRFAREAAQRQGREPEEFDFLGFTHYCGQTRQGRFKVQRRTAAKKFRAKLKELKAWLQQERNRIKGGELLQQAKRRLVGYLNYYAITDNYRMCRSFRAQFQRMLLKWMNRRSQRRSFTVEQFQSALDWVGWPSVRVVHPLDPFRRVVGLEGS